MKHPVHPSATVCALLLGITLFVVALVPTASAQDAEIYEDQVVIQLDAMADAVAESGFEVTHDYVVAALDSDGDDSFTVTLDKGVTYLIASVCDEDCSDVDIQLHDENDNLIDVDEQEDGFPIAEVTPAWTGEFTITVHMFQCDREPCFYGIGVFGQ